MRNNTTSFRLVSTLETEIDGKVEKNSYEQTIRVRFLRKIASQPFYDQENKMSFVNDTNTQYIFELEIDNVRLFLSRRLATASEFLRATHYRYDWMQVSINRKGRPITVYNKPEILGRWEKMKMQLRRTYKGDAVDMYIEKLDTYFDTQTASIPPLFHYFYFGLVFPNIPIKHKADWSNIRMIELSESEEEKFEETICFRGNEEGLNNYQISGRTLDGSVSQLSKFEGILKTKPMQFLPESVNVSVEFSREDVHSKWSFELKKAAI